MKQNGVYPTLGAMALLLLAGLYAGAAFSAGDSCLSCHEDDAGVKGIMYRAHGQAADHRMPAGDAMCEACHGQSDAHADKPRANKPARVFSAIGKLTADEKNAVCTDCHKTGHQKAWPTSEHASADVSCVNCHEVHSTQDRVQKKQKQFTVCVGCHVEQKVDAGKFSRHPLKEGVVVCTDCHDTHGGKGPSMLKQFTVNETCYECHTEKRGPFLFEHEPVQDDCTNCHVPHGSVHDNMLMVRMPQLCQQCHDDTSHRGYDYAQPVDGRGNPFLESSYIKGKQCLSCHGEIHGSNHASGGAYFE